MIDVDTNKPHSFILFDDLNSSLVQMHEIVLSKHVLSNVFESVVTYQNKKDNKEDNEKEPETSDEVSREMVSKASAPFSNHRLCSLSDSGQIYPCALSGTGT